MEENGGYLTDVVGDVLSQSPLSIFFNEIKKLGKSIIRKYI
jgi:hypothetical protein